MFHLDYQVLYMMTAVCAALVVVFYPIYESRGALVAMFLGKHLDRKFTPILY